MKSVDEIKKILMDYFRQEDSIKFVYMFGSYAKNQIGKLSDIDIAVYLDDDLDSDTRFNKRLSFIGDISKKLKQDNIDLVVLNDINILLAFQVVFSGKIIYCKDEMARINYEAKTMSLFFDQQYYFKRHADLNIENIAKRGLS